MNRKEFFEKLNGTVTAGDLVSISQAYWLAKVTHRGQKRKNGERYFEHCRRVAITLVKYGPTNVNEIIIAFLHDCVEDGFIPQDLIRVLFGEFVAQGVEILSKYRPRFDGATGKIKEKIRISDSKYYRGISSATPLIRRVKLADRLDNVRDLNVRPPRRRREYILETKKYILPIARATDLRFLKALERKCR